jgi:hypothetical protein
MTPEEARALPTREAVYPLSEGLSNKRMGQIAEQAVARAPQKAAPSSSPPTMSPCATSPTPPPISPPNLR